MAQRVLGTDRTGHEEIEIHDFMNTLHTTSGRITSQPIPPRDTMFRRTVGARRDQTKLSNTTHTMFPKLNPKGRILAMLIATAFCGAVLSPRTAVARQGATDPIPGTSNGGVKSGGGGKKGGGGSTPAPAPAPAPAPQPIVYGTLTFSAAGAVNGSLPQCTGDYQVDPYYPTLSLFTVRVQVNTLNVPDGTVLYVHVIGSSGVFYPFTGNAVVIVAGSGSCSHSEYVTLDAGLAGVTITDASGAILFVGN